MASAKCIINNQIRLKTIQMCWITVKRIIIITIVKYPPPIPPGLHPILQEKEKRVMAECNTISQQRHEQ